MSTLQITDLRASVAGKQILHGVDLTVSSGEVHVVMGPNGAGKSSMLNCINGVYTPQEGSITFRGNQLISGVALNFLASGLTVLIAQALFGLKTGYEAAIKANGGKWPAPEQVAEAMRTMKFKAFGREITKPAGERGRRRRG